MKKRFVLVICSVLFALSSYAAWDAKSVLDKATTEFRKCPSVNVTFEVAIGDDTDTGTILLQGSKFYTQLSNTTTWFDGKTMWSYVKDNEEVNVTEPKSAQLAKMNPYAFIDMYKKGYDVSFGVNTKAYYEVVLTSTNSKNSIQKAIIRIDRFSYQPKYIMMGGSKAEIEIKVTSYKKGKKQADSTFRFNKSKYPRAEIIDLR
ncbi:MAG: cell envelope biogenesis protein LolA [Bacteroidaceae bacterium]|nr:cell envelope biogenesis protein LolA [Bacteroidaceae bacterium]